MSQRSDIGEVTETARRFSPAMFGIVALCFLLPFVAVTCGGQELFQLKGIDLVTGTEVNEDDLTDEVQSMMSQFEEGLGDEATESDDEGDRIDPQVWAIVALAAAIIGAVVGALLRNRTGQLTSAISGIVGVVSLILLRATFSIETETDGAQGIGELDVGYEWGAGWWLALVLFLVQPLIHYTTLPGLGRGSDADGATPPPSETGTSGGPAS